MKLGIPTLVRYDLLDFLLKSAEAGSVKPSEYVIIDNGTGLLESGVELPKNTRIIHQGTNLGVARSWNLFLDDAGDEPIVISNDDVAFTEHTFRDLSAALVEHAFVEGDGWCLFGQGPECTKRVGYYDEHFWPAYYEDSDYDVRLDRAGIPRVKALTGPFMHEGWATIKKLGDEAWLREGRERSRQYFLRKWGGEAAPTFDHLFPEAWNGAPPEGFELRGPWREAPLMRWDILNQIAERIGAKRYLEIGVSDGTNMNRIAVADKWGVDPNPTISGVSACSVFVPKPSLEFFLGPPCGRFDLIFIDGHHDAELVYQEVWLAAGRLLAPGGVIALHNSSPSTEDMQRMPGGYGEWTGNVWKAVAWLRADGFSIRTVDTDYGVAVIDGFPDERRFEADRAELEWVDLRARRTALLGLIDPWAWVET